MLEALAKIGGVTGLTIGVFYLLYWQILSLGVFRALSANQTFFFLCFAGALIWLLAMAALIRTDKGLNVLLFSNLSHIQQGIAASQ